MYNIRPSSWKTPLEQIKDNSKKEETNYIPLSIFTSKQDRDDMIKLIKEMSK